MDNTLADITEDWYFISYRLHNFERKYFSTFQFSYWDSRWYHPMIIADVTLQHECLDFSSKPIYHATFVSFWRSRLSLIYSFDILNRVIDPNFPTTYQFADNMCPSSIILYIFATRHCDTSARVHLSYYFANNPYFVLFCKLPVVLMHRVQQKEVIYHDNCDGVKLGGKFASHNGLRESWDGILLHEERVAVFIVWLMYQIFLSCFLFSRWQYMG